MDCAQVVATGAVSLPGLQVTGSIDLTEARITSPGPGALMIGNAVIGGRLIGRGLQVDGEMVLQDTSVTRIELAGARLHHPAGNALSAGGRESSGAVTSARHPTWLLPDETPAQTPLIGIQVPAPPVRLDLHGRPALCRRGASSEQSIARN
jgi:hypothetical protein